MYFDTSKLQFTKRHIVSVASFKIGIAGALQPTMAKHSAVDQWWK